jgi:hypothetical protein
MDVGKHRFWLHNGVMHKVLVENSKNFVHLRNF